MTSTGTALLLAMRTSLAKLNLASNATSRRPRTTPIRPESLKRARGAFCAVSIAAIELLQPFSPAAAADVDWRRLGDADFPVKVTAIKGLPATMDAGRTVTWGSWTVFFKPTKPIATSRLVGFSAESGDGLTSITISPLRCRNPAVGERDCTMIIHRFFGAQKFDDCFIDHSGGDTLSQAQSFRINCPSSWSIDRGK